MIPIQQNPKSFAGAQDDNLWVKEVQQDKRKRRVTPLHTQEPVTVASFRTWRGWRECVARDPAPLDFTILSL